MGSSRSCVLHCVIPVNGVALVRSQETSHLLDQGWAKDQAPVERPHLKEAALILEAGVIIEGKRRTRVYMSQDDSNGRVQ